MLTIKFYIDENDKSEIHIDENGKIKKNYIERICGENGEIDFKNIEKEINISEELLSRMKTINGHNIPDDIIESICKNHDVSKACIFAAKDRILEAQDIIHYPCQIAIAYLTSDGKWISKGHWPVQVDGSIISLPKVNIIDNFYWRGLVNLTQHYSQDLPEKEATGDLSIGLTCEGYMIGNMLSSFRKLHTEDRKSFYYKKSSFEKYDALDQRSIFKKFFLIGDDDYYKYDKIDIGNHKGNELTLSFVYRLYCNYDESRRWKGESPMGPDYWERERRELHALHAIHKHYQ